MAGAVSDCRSCPSAAGCRCRFVASGLATVSGVNPRIFDLPCETVQDACAPMFELIGFDYDDATGKLIVPVGVDPAAILTSNGDGTASWVDP